MHALTRYLATVAIAACAAVPARGDQQASASPAGPAQVANWLTSYADGRQDQAVGLASGATGRVDQLLIDHASAWVDDSDPGDERGRRRLVAATFALHLAAASERPDSLVGLQDLKYRTHRLLSWGGLMLTRQRPGPPGIPVPAPDTPVRDGELSWFLAAAALLQNTASFHELLDPAKAPGVLRSPSLPGLLPTALRRFPSAAGLLMAQAAAEFYVADSRLGLTGRRPDFHVLGLAQRNALLDAASRYRRLLNVPPVAAEAHLRFGYLQFLLGDRQSARAHEASADRLSTDALLRYQSRLISAWTWQADRRVDEAAAAYRSALDLFPLARSAAVPLGALLMEDGWMVEASSLIERALLTRPAPADPLDRFGSFDGWQWPEGFSRLREVVR